jgi:hypothetical protein
MRYNDTPFAADIAGIEAGASDTVLAIALSRAASTAGRMKKPNTHAQLRSPDKMLIVTHLVWLV